MNSNSTSEKTNSFKKIIVSFLIVALGLPISEAWAQTNFYPRTGGSIRWDAENAWEMDTPTGRKNTKSSPSSLDIVYLTRDMNIPTVANSLTGATNFYCRRLVFTTPNVELLINPGQTLNVQEDVIINSPVAAADSVILEIGQGILNVGNNLYCGSNATPSSAGNVKLRVKNNGKLKVTGNILNDNAVNNLAESFLILKGTGILEVGGGLTLGPNLKDIFTDNSIVRFNGTSSQTIPNIATFGNLHIANSTGVGLSGSLHTGNLTGNLVVESGKLEDKGYAITGASGNKLEVWAGAKLVLSHSNLSTSNAFPAGFTKANIELDPASTVVFNGNSLQRIAAHTYGKLEFLGGPGKVKLLAGNTTAANTLVAADLLLDLGYLSIGANTLTLATTGSIQNYNSGKFIKLAAGGKMVVESIGQTLGARNSVVTFPIGTSNFTPAYLKNLGTTYDFSIGVVDGVVDYANNNTPILQDGVNKTWNVECINQVNGFNPAVELRLQWNAATDQLSNFDNTKCFVTHYTNNAWTTSDNFQNAAQNGMSVSMQGITSFSPFSVADAPSPLPVELVFFKAAKKENSVLLTWETASEKNCQGYDIQASADGKNFETVGYLASKNGNANYAQRYEFLDKTSRQGLVYYRLKQTDLDGTVAYYATKVVDMGRGAETLVAYPNPFQNQFKLTLQSIAAQEIQVEVKDLTGKTVYQKAPKVAAGNATIPVELGQNLPAGMYILTAKTADQLFATRLIKQ